MSELVKTFASAGFVYLPNEFDPDESGIWINLAQVTSIHEFDNRIKVKFTNNKYLTFMGTSLPILKAELARLSGSPDV